MESESILKIVKERDQHGLEIKISDDNQKNEPKLTLTLRSDKTDQLPQLIEYMVQNWEDGKAELARKD